MADDPKERGEPSQRRGDNVGQSGRCRRADGTESDEAARRYGHEERWHSTEHPEGAPSETHDHQPNSDKPSTSPYEGRFAQSEKGEERGDDKARYSSEDYSDAGGALGPDRPQYPGKRWKDEGGAGHGEEYGSGRDEADENKASTKPPRR